MAHAKKYTMAAVGHMLNHYGRYKGDGVQRANEQIDPARTAQNYNLAPKREVNEYEYLKQRLSEIKHLDLNERKDINVMIDWVITLPEDVPLDKAKDFFDAAYDFNIRRYGEQNVISANIHMDETTPHMHFAFVPAVIGRDGTERLCAKEVISRVELRRYHPALQKFVEQRMGQSVAVLNGATAGGNLTILELKARSALEKLAGYEQQSILAEQSEPITAEIRGIIAAVKSDVEQIYNDLKTVKGALVGGKTKAKAEIVAQNLAKTEEFLQRLQTLADDLKTACDILPKTAKCEIKQYFRDFNRLTNKTRRELTRQLQQVAARSAAIDDEINARVQAKIDEIEGDIMAGAIAERNQIQRETAEMRDKLQQMGAELNAKQQQLWQIDTQLFFAQQPFLETAIINQQQQQEIIDKWTEGENHARTDD